jgi:hypothetical protein
MPTPALILFAAVLAAVLAAPQDGRPLAPEQCLTVAHTPIVVTQDDACLRLIADLVHTDDWRTPAITWEGKRGQLHFDGHALTLTDRCARGIVIAGGAELAVFDAVVVAPEETTCTEMHGMLGDYEATLELYNAQVINASTGVFVRGDGVLRAENIDIINYTYHGIGCQATRDCRMERVAVRASDRFNFQTGIILGGQSCRASGLASFNSYWRSVSINGTGPTAVEDVTVEAHAGLLIEIEVEDAVSLRNVRTSTTGFYGAHIGVVQASSMTLEDWIARDGDVGLLINYAATVRGITVRNADVTGLYYGVYMRDNNWNLMVRDSSFATCCIGVLAEPVAHNIIVTSTLFENNFDSIDITTPESVVSGNLNTGDGTGFCYSPLAMQRRGNMPPAVPGHHVTPDGHTMWWVLPHPYNNETATSD